MKTSKTNNIGTFVALILFCSLSSIYTVNAQTAVTGDKIIAALGKGDAEQVALRFAPSVELATGSNNDTYKLEEAKKIVADFFAANTVESFLVHHKSYGSQSGFIIGTLTTANGTFRVYVLLRGKNPEIQQFRIEKEQK
ncbi:MAG: DUF4783 domain-containing protein [Prevotellaceae bacterium]|jgi:hypothetical protein|nr:DUF4783 domain-containing protein [Prevotellaceae bacterium]